ncbi:MAG TPA: DUF481 domain-containing protein [Acidobacteriaceae bacterium]|jgi:hypothetical protein|nr:DUF481 domain-containing protein [Acidobacteriaceae bacterium]
MVRLLSLFRPRVAPVFPLSTLLILTAFSPVPLRAAVSSTVAAPMAAAGAARKPAQPAPDSLTFTNGDHLSGKLVRAVGDEVVFHSDILGDLTIKWSQIRDLQTGTQLAVIERSVLMHHRHLPAGIPEGSLTVADQLITVHPASGAMIAPIPLKSAEYVVDETTLKRQIAGHPGVFAGWNGAITGGATIVQASQDQYTFAGSVSLTRLAPTVTWLNTDSRTLVDFSGSFGKIIQPAYANDGVMTPASTSKSSIYHADAERDGYFSPRFYVLGQTSFDHNFAQDLDLQQIYGAGIGWTAIKNPILELDVKSTLQYEGQTFIAGTSGENQNLIGSTLNGTWAAKLPHKVLFKQQVSWIPAYNNPYAYSAGETDSLSMPFFKRLAFSLGSDDSYLNDPPAASPPTKRNSFQLTTGLTYAIKSKY